MKIAKLLTSFKYCCLKLQSNNIDTSPTGVSHAKTHLPYTSKHFGRFKVAMAIESKYLK